MSSSEQESQFTPEKPSKSQNRSKSENRSSKAKKGQPAKQNKAKTAKGKKKQKPAKSKDKPAKKKKDKKQEVPEGQVKEIVFQYMQKQNRPYNLLNVFDNLHGTIKKSVLEVALNELAEEQSLTCKEFGKNKVSKEKVDGLSKESNELKEKEQVLMSQYKTKLQELKRLLAKKTLPEIIEQVNKTKEKIDELEVKKKRLTNVDAEKIDQAEVDKIEKQQTILKKQLNKRRKLTKQCLKTWSQILQKKVPQVADMMGVQL